MAEAGDDEQLNPAIGVVEVTAFPIKSYLIRLSVATDRITPLDTGETHLLDFQISSLDHRAFDSPNLLAETRMRHEIPEYPYFGIAEPTHPRDDIGALVDGCLEACSGEPPDRETLTDQVFDMILLSDFVHVVATLPLAVEPIQKIQFIPCALQRFERFVSDWEKRFA